MSIGLGSYLENLKDSELLDHLGTVLGRTVCCVCVCVCVLCVCVCV